MEVASWIKLANSLTKTMETSCDSFKSVSSNYESIKDAASEEQKEEVDDCYTALTKAKSALCGLHAGGKKTRRHRKFKGAGAAPSRPSVQRDPAGNAKKLAKIYENEQYARNYLERLRAMENKSSRRPRITAKTYKAPTPKAKAG